MTNQTLTSSQDTSTQSSLLFLAIFIKTTLLSFVFVFILLLITAVVMAGIVYAKIQNFETLAQVKKETIFSDLKVGWQNEPKQTDNRTTFLILGTDELANRGNVQVLTDTMLLVTIHLDTGEAHLLSIPRDLWSNEYKTKVNALYSYGSERYPAAPQQFPTQVIGELTNIPIHHTIVISLETLAKLIDAVGGITVDVPTSFTDTQFPRTDVDVTVERDPAKLYKTVTFESGSQTMTGEKALEYIRSRHSTDVEQGSDTARADRQQLVIQAIMQKALSRDTITSTEKVAGLYTLFNTTFSQYITLPELVSLAKVLYPYRTSIAFKQHSLSIYPQEEDGVIFHPPEKNYQNQWVYAIRDEEQFKAEIRRELIIKN